MTTPALPDGPFQSPQVDDNRIDKLEQLLMTQNLQNQVFQDIIINSLGLEYQDDEEYNYADEILTICLT